MRRIIGLSLLGMVALASGVMAQYPPNYGGTPWGRGYGGYGGYEGLGPHPGAAAAFRGPNAPLSPYLNLLGGGGNPATNYYNFVRPFTYSPFRNASFSPFSGGSGRQAFFSTLRDIDEDDLEKSVRYRPEGDKEDRVHMAPTGHAAAYGNTMGYYGPMTAAQGGPGSAGSHAAMKPTGSKGAKK